MHNRIIEIIVQLVSQLHGSNDINEAVFRTLASEGYTTSEISTACSWLEDRKEFSGIDSGHALGETTSLRVLTPEERACLSTAAEGYLHQMLQLGLITNEHVEMVLHECLYKRGNNVESAELKTIIARVIFNASSGKEPGSRSMLYGTDTVH